MDYYRQHLNGCMKAENLGGYKSGKYSLVSLEHSAVFQCFSNISCLHTFCWIIVLEAVGTAMGTEKWKALEPVFSEAKEMYLKIILTSARDAQ